MSLRQSGWFGAALLVFTAGACAQSPPPNDDFASRTALTGSLITFTGTLAGATLESAETNQSFPDLFTYGGSVWWTWTAPVSSTVVFATVWDSSGSSNAWLTVYAGTDLTQLSGLDANALSYPLGRYVRLAASAGTW